MSHYTRVDEAMDEVDKPFLSTGEDIADGLPAPARRASPSNICLFSICINFIFISAYTILFFTVSAHYWNNGATAINRKITAITEVTYIIYLFRKALPGLKFNYVAQKYIYVEASPFSGPPSSSADEAWHKLLNFTNLRASASELQLSNQTSVELPDGGYMVWLSVFHQLHCIKMLRQWRYREHYHPQIPEEDKPHWEIHLDHCLDLLRSATMCHADTTLTTFRWVDNPKPMLNTRRVDHKCIDWEGLMGSIEHRVVDSDEMSRMVNPNRG
ncbi:hypothetical protein F5Y07DRAFT_394502 [Xylaria sp. FL0933]|nr:hypothetical protein F5Y07DRAFT_394502 [Xylaria sp. FL0933]